MKWPSVNPGDMRHQITIKRPVVASGVSGSKVTYEAFCSAYAAIAPARAEEVLQNGQTVSKLYIPITVNYQPGIQPKMQVVAPNGTYIIENIINAEELNVVLTLMCIALTSANL